MNKKFRALVVRISYLLRALRLVWAAAPSLTVAWIVLLAIQGVLPAATVYLTRQLVDSLVAAISTSGTWETLRPLLGVAGLMAGVILLTEFLRSASEWIRTAQSEFVQDYIKLVIHEKSTTVDLAFYESPDYYDRLHRAQNDASNRPLVLLENGGSLLQNGITLVTMAAILIPYGWWLPLVLFVSTLPALQVVFLFNRRYHHWWEQTTPKRRRTQYYDILLTNSAFAAEIRLFGLGPKFQSFYQALRQQLRSERMDLVKDQGLARLGAGLIAVVMSGAALAWMVWQALQGAATLGDLALFYQAFNRGQNLMRSLLENVGKIYNNSLFLGNLFEFLDLEPRIVGPARSMLSPDRLEKGIYFRDITFRYPGSDRAALRNFDLFVPAGKIIAIVGANGAGKSTLVKLLCRFYDPQEGAVELDGVDIRSISPDELRRKMTVMFQLPVPYQTSARQNIALGDLTAEPTAQEVESAARGAGVHETIMRLPQGYDTLLGKWFSNGTELSTGEWQRIALARAFLRQAQIIILDEPTSFMDSWAEADWLARFRTLVKKQTAMVITHRFTTAMQADIIHVIDNGQILESGTHRDLLAKGGRYAQSWAVQTQATSSQEDTERNGNIQSVAKPRSSLI